MDSKTILLAEDEEIVSQVITAILERLGYDVIQAKNGVEALEKFQEYKNELSVMILDYNMPKMNGLECIWHIRQSSYIPIILSTGFGDTFTKNDLNEYQVNSLLQKPYTFSTVQEVLQEVGLES